MFGSIIVGGKRTLRTIGLWAVIVAAVLLIALVGLAAATAGYQFVAKWGSLGTGNGQLDYPEGVAVDSSGDVYVADSDNDRIQKFSADGTYLAKWGRLGSSNGRFNWPSALAFDASDNLFVADTDNNRIQKFTSAGTYLSKWGGYGTGDGFFNAPAGIAVAAPDGSIYVSDRGNHRIQKFTAAGVFVTKWGIYGTGNGEFKYPEGIGVDGSGNVYVMDSLGNRVQKFNSAGTYLTKWSSGFNDAEGLAVDSAGNVFVADMKNHRIQKFTSAGAFLTRWGAYGASDGSFKYPRGVAVSSNGFVYVADTLNDRVQKFHDDPARFDKPTGSVLINSGAANTNKRSVVLRLSATDPHGPVTKMRFRNGDDAWSAWGNYATSKSWTLKAGAGDQRVYAQFRDADGNRSAEVSDLILYDPTAPRVSMVAPFTSTRISKTTTFKVKWSANDASPSSGIKNYFVRYRPSTSRSWRVWKSNTKSTYGYFTGKAGVTYYFRTKATDNAGNRGWSKVYKTTLPFNEGIFLKRRKIGFKGYKKLGKSQNYLTSVRYSYTRGNVLVYKLYKNNGIGLIVTKGPKMGRAKIYVDGKYVRTVDARSSKVRPRQLIFYKGFAKKRTHWLKVVNLGTPGRARFEVDAVFVGR